LDFFQVFRPSIETAAKSRLEDTVSLSGHWKGLDILYFDDVICGSSVPPAAVEAQYSNINF